MKILFIRLGALGDVIQAAAAVRMLKQRYPEILIDWVVDSAFGVLVRSFEVSNNVIEIRSDKILKGNLLIRLTNLIIAITKLAKLKHYDVIVTAHPDWRYTLLSTLVKTRRHLTPADLGHSDGFITKQNRTLEYYRLLSKAIQENKSNASPLKKLSIDEALESIGDCALSYSHDKTSVKDLLKSTPHEYIALVPGGAKNELREDPLRRWPIDCYVQLASLLIESGKNIVLLGGPGDIWVNPEFKDLKVTNLIGKTTLLDMVFILNQAQAVVCHDSGPLHIASITNTPMIAIFGPTPATAIISFARYKTEILEPSTEIACSPCYDGKNYASCENNICMKSTTVDRVLLKLNSLIKP